MLDVWKRGMGTLVGAAWIVLLMLLVLAVSAGSGSAQESEAAARGDHGGIGAERVQPGRRAASAEIEEKVEVLTEEVGRLESIFAVPEEVRLESFSGLGPAASKVYKRDQGLSIGGYGEVRLRSFHNQDSDDQNDIFDALRAVLYVGYKFNDQWLVNSELEFEHAGTRRGRLGFDRVS